VANRTGFNFSMMRCGFLPEFLLASGPPSKDSPFLSEETVCLSFESTSACSVFLPWKLISLKFTPEFFYTFIVFECGIIGFFPPSLDSGPAVTRNKLATDALGSLRPEYLYVGKNFLPLLLSSLDLLTFHEKLVSFLLCYFFI